jgi:serine/threonine-protein kinase HipA
MTKMSIQGVQPKLSVILDVRASEFRVTDRGGMFILKPQSEYYPELPENEDLSMHLAAVCGLETPFHCLIRSVDGRFSYLVRRFDRRGKEKIPVEDFAQLSGRSRESKYDSSMEQAAEIVERYCSFPVPEKVKCTFRRNLPPIPDESCHFSPQEKLPNHSITGGRFPPESLL